MKKWEERERGGKVIYAILNAGPLSISVHRQINSSPDIWFLSCANLNVFNVQLGSKELDHACVEAELKVYGIMKNAISIICGDL